MDYDELTQYQKRTLNADLKKLVNDMDRLGVEVLNLSFYLNKKEQDDETTHTNTTPRHHNR